MTRFQIVGALIVGLFLVASTDTVEARSRRCRSRVGFGSVFSPYGGGYGGGYGGIGYGYPGYGYGGGLYGRPIGYTYPSIARPIYGYGGGGYYGGIGYGGGYGYGRSRRRNRTRNVLLGIGAAALIGALLSR